MKKILLLSFMLLLTLSFNAFAQRTVTGSVTDSNGEGLPGVSVLLKGTTTGGITDIDGKYQVTVPSDGGILQFSFIGLQTQEVEIGARSVIDVTMAEDIKTLTEVVVTGFGEITKDQLTSAVSTIDNSEIAAFNPSLSIDNILQGKASGVSITAANGRPGNSALVRIRGTGSIQAGQDPLYVVDGVPIDASNINSISPTDIESVSVLKDAGTAALYGSRAGNGVILIKTKSGSKKGPEITFRASYGTATRIEDNFDLLTAEQNLQYESELAALGLGNAASLPGGRLPQEQWGPFLNRATNWEDVLLRDATIENQSISINGGSEDATYFLSINRDVNDGIIDQIEGFERISARLNTTFQVNDYLKIGFNINVSNATTDLPRDRNNVQNPIRALYDYKPYATPFVTNDNGVNILDANGNRQFNFGEGIALGFNIAEALVNNTEDNKNLVTIANAFADIKISDNFSNRVNIGFSGDRFQRESFLKPGSRLDQFVGDANNPGSKTDNGSNDYRLVFTNLFSYNQVFGDVHNIGARALIEYNDRRFSSFTLTSEGFVSDRLSVQNVASIPTAAGSFNSRNVLLSYGGFFDYSYDDRYVASFSVRRDGSSRFGSQNRWGTFGAVSAAWNLHNEDFFSVDFINSLKVRGSYGLTGNQSIGDFQAISTVQFGSRNGASTVIPVGEADFALQWEQQAVLDFGFEASVWDNRITVVGDYFRRVSSDLLGNRPLSNTIGDENNQVLTNVGELQNTGFELEISASLVSTRDFQLTVGGNLTLLDSKVNELSEGADIFRRFTLLREGEEVNTFFLNRYAGVNPANGEPLYLDADDNVTNVFNGEDAVALEGKSAQASYLGGGFVSARWKQIDFRADVVYSGGNYIYNGQRAAGEADGAGVNRNQYASVLNYWKQPGDVDVLPNPVFGQPTRVSDRFLEKGDYVRLRNLTIGYSIPKNILDKIRLKNARIYLQGQNLITIRPFYTGDPEVGIGSGETVGRNNANFVPGQESLFSYPQTRSYTAGIQIGF